MTEAAEHHEDEKSKVDPKDRGKFWDALFIYFFLEF